MYCASAVLMSRSIVPISRFLSGAFRLFLLVSFRFAIHINHRIKSAGSGVVGHDLLRLFCGYHNDQLSYFRAFYDGSRFVAAQGRLASTEPKVAISDSQVGNRRFTEPWISDIVPISNDSDLEMVGRYKLICRRFRAASKLETAVFVARSLRCPFL